MFYALQFHPSYQAVHSLTNQIMHTSVVPAFQFHEVDGAYSNERLNAHYLSVAGFDACSGGFFFDHSRCQNHASHLITVAILNLVGFNALSKLYQLTVFLSNLGYVLRLQIALRDWLVDNLILDSQCDLTTLTPDPLMSEVRQYIDSWHVSQGKAQTSESATAKTLFDKKLEAFGDMWNDSAAGPPKHKCNCGIMPANQAHCCDRKQAAEKMSQSMIDLLLTSCPSPPAPNKWTKLWRPVDFVAVGILVNGFLPSIFDIAFKSMNFNTAAPSSAEDMDPRIIEKLQFHEVQGKRFLGSQAFLQDPGAQFAVRLLLVALEPLRFLTDSWLANLNRLKAGDRAPLHVLLDPRSSPVVASLQKVSGMLQDGSGQGRLIFLWGSSFDSFDSWCKIRPDQVRAVRQVLMTLAALIHRRHVVYWDQFPWPLAVVSDPSAGADLKAEILQKWDAVHACCVRPGLARNLKQMNITGKDLEQPSLVPPILALKEFGWLLFDTFSGFVRGGNGRANDLIRFDDVLYDS